MASPLNVELPGFQPNYSAPLIRGSPPPLYPPPPGPPPQGYGAPPPHGAPPGYGAPPPYPPPSNLPPHPLGDTPPAAAASAPPYGQADDSPVLPVNPRTSAPNTPPENADEVKLKAQITSVKTEYSGLQAEFVKLQSANPPTDETGWTSFGKKVETAQASLDKAAADLQAFKVKTTPDGPSSSASSASETPVATLAGATLAETPGASKQGGSSSKKNRKSHKSYRPIIGKTRKHHSRADPKKISFVHYS